MEIHFNKKDFKIEWYSGTGKGGQHRNKHQNCCRITHLETGLKANGAGSRERSVNQRVAFENLSQRIISYYAVPKERRNTTEVIRNYHEPRNEVLDKASGIKSSYKDVVINGNIADMVEARRMSMINLDLDK